MAPITKPRIKSKVLSICNALIRLNNAAYKWEQKYIDDSKKGSPPERHPVLINAAYRVSIERYHADLRHCVRNVTETWEKIIHLANEMKKVIGPEEKAMDKSAFKLLRQNSDWLIGTASVQIGRFTGKRPASELNPTNLRDIYKGTGAYIKQMEDYANQYLA